MGSGASRGSRRDVLWASLAAAGGTAVAASAALAQSEHVEHPAPAEPAATQGGYEEHGGHGMVTVGEVDHSANGFDPSTILSDWETGTVETMPDGRTLRSG
jgi:manganese oxidase